MTMRWPARELLAAADNNGYIVIEMYSSLVEQIAYDLKTETCVVTLKNDTDYTYKHVSFDSFYQFANTESPGFFYNFYVKGRW